MMTFAKLHKKTIFSLFVGILFVLCMFFISSSVKAYPILTDKSLDANQFDPGRIIDDDVFTNANSMTAAEIQTFLETVIEGGKCKRYQQNFYKTNAKPPYTCLFEYQQNPTTGQSNYGLFTDDGAPATVEGGLTAAQIIYQAAQRYQINPQVLIVLLQKEQSLVTDAWPWTNQYRKATGYGCPDFQACASATAGFYKQVMGAAWQFRKYLDETDRYWYIIGNNNILYNPNTACGSTVVNIQNKATIALYLYTPFVPNQAALNNLYGTGNSCSAYGNRNFWTYFNSWFGASRSDRPITPSVSLNNNNNNNDDDDDDAENEDEGENKIYSEGFSYENYYPSVYSDENEQSPLNSNRAIEVLGFTNLYVTLNYENTGTPQWTKAEGEKQVYLVTVPDNTPSAFCHTSWLQNCRKIALFQQTTVASGEKATFKFAITVPNISGKQDLVFNLKNNQGYLKGDSIKLSFNVALNANMKKTTGNSNNQDKTDDDNSPIEERLPKKDNSQTVSPPTTVTLPPNWKTLSVREKIRLNPWGCHDTTKIRADNGRCLSGGYTIPQQKKAEPEKKAPIRTTTTAPNNPNDNQQGILPSNWKTLSVLEKIRLNPWGCHDTTKIRADNGRCLSGGYTLPKVSNNVASNTPTTVADKKPSPTTVKIPSNWQSLSVKEKIRLNPWGCHDTTKIRADNGRCLSGGYTIPNQAA